MPSGESLPQRVALNSVSTQKVAANGQSAEQYAAGIPNTFAGAQNIQLTDAALDSYIDARIQGTDRALARKLMKYMLAAQRGDFVYVGADGRLISNNPSILPHYAYRKADVRYADSC